MVSGQTERIEWEDAAPPRAARQRAKAVLEAGGIVALPTETVYGLAVRGDDPAAVARLRALKGSDPARPLTWHVGERAALEHFPAPSAMARRLAQRYWPGPLTLVLPGVPSMGAKANLEAVASDGWTGVRLPAHKATAELLNALDFPVVATSANPAGGDPLSSAEQIATAFAGGIELVLDGGDPRLGEASGVLKLGPGHFDVLREGLISAEQLRAVAGMRIGFICTGNTCRSPMAEGLARDLVAKRLEVPVERVADFGFEFSSCGVLGGSGMPPSAHGVQTLAARGIDISGHQSSPTYPEQVKELDLVLALTASHLDSLRLIMPPGGTRHCELLDPEGGDVPDPIGGTLADYQRTADRIAAAIERRLPDWI